MYVCACVIPEAETYTVQSMLNTPCIIGYQLQCVGSEAALEECGFKDNQCGSMYAGVRCMEDGEIVW